MALRILRAYRVDLCNQYCQGILGEVYKDSVKIQVLETASKLRLRALLLPKQAQIFRMGKTGEIQENLSYEAFQTLDQMAATIDPKGCMSISSVLGGQGLCSSSQTLFYIPSSEEICLCDRRASSADDLEQAQKVVMQQSVDFFFIDKAVKSRFPEP